MADPKETNLVWVIQQTNDTIQQRLGGMYACGVCLWENNRQRTKEHTRQHYIRVYCACPYGHV